MMSDSLKKIVWIASYPKSGNTWFRLFLTSLLKKESEVLNINNMKTFGIFSKRDWFDNITGTASSDLLPEEINILRPKVFEWIAERSENTMYIKAHDAYIFNKKRQPIFPSAASKATIYIIRNPLDVAVSYAFHNGYENKLDEIVDDLCNNKHRQSFSNDSLYKQLDQLMLSWGNHAKSWTNQNEIPVKIIRYEDMLLKPIETFTTAINTIGLDFSEEKISKAINDTKFENLKKLELKYGFREKSPVSGSFFRNGKIGNWRSFLTTKQVNKIINFHGETMREFGYLNDNNHVIF